MAVVVALNTSREKGTAKHEVGSVALKPDYGVVGDAHAGPGKRQVSLLALESYNRFEEKNLKKICKKIPGGKLCYGSFGENIVTEGIVLHELAVGTRLMIGGAVCEVTQIGKECHAGCSIAKTIGSCIMPKEGIFVKVLEGAVVRKGDGIRVMV